MCAPILTYAPLNAMIAAIRSCFILQIGVTYLRFLASVFCNALIFNGLFFAWFNRKLKPAATKALGNYSTTHSINKIGRLL